VDTYLARQAVFNRGLNVIGYELLFRSGAENFFCASDGDQATLKVIETSLNTFGLGGLASGGRVFVNVTRRMLLEGYTSLLPAKSSVIELLGSVTPDREVVEACRALKKAGGLIALDEFKSSEGPGPLLALADFVKVDYQAASPEERKRCASAALPPGAKLLAKKIGIQREFKEAADLGYSLFQGIFFSKPEMMFRKQVPAYKLVHLECLAEVNRPEPDFRKIEDFFRRDLALSVKLLRYVNSALVSPARKMDSLKQAIAMVGLDQLRKWVSMVALVAMGEDKPGELLVTSLVRARFCEHLALMGELKPRAPELFMIGMLSVLDVIMGRPMLEMLGDLPISDEAKGALLGKAGVFGDILGLVFAYERAEWDLIPYYLDQLIIKDKLTMDLAVIPLIYRDSVAWADQTFRGATGDSGHPPSHA